MEHGQRHAADEAAEAGGEASPGRRQQHDDDQRPEHELHDDAAANPLNPSRSTPWTANAGPAPSPCAAAGDAEEHGRAEQRAEELAEPVEQQLAHAIVRANHSPS